MFCRNCGVENIDGAKFCKNCGTAFNKINEDEVNTENIHSRKGKESSRKLIYILGAVVLFIAIIAAVFIGMQTKTTKEYNTYLASAEKYLEEMDYEQAEAMYLNAIAIAPKKLEPYVKLANVYLITGEPDKAEIIIEQAEEANAKGDEEVEEDYEKLKKIVEEADSLVNYQWVVEPTIEADDIYYVQEDSYGDYYEDSPLNNMYRQIKSVYAVIRQGERLGLIKMNGEMLGGMDYNWIAAYEGSYMLQRIEPKWEPEWETEWEFYWQEGDELVADLGIGDFGSSAFYYCDGLHELNEQLEWTEEMREPTVPIPVKKSEKLLHSEEGYQYREWGHLKGNYGIYYDGKMRTDFIYEECGSYSEGLMAVCQNGKWGYVNESGEVIIPLEYDASWPQFKVDWDGFMDKQGVRDYCYAATEGYVVLCKGNQYELRNTNGQLAIPSGVFEIIRPVFDGKCWVRQNGKWGVIEILEKNTGEEYSFFDTMPETFSYLIGVGNWATDFTIESKEGAFSGEYYDLNMGEDGDEYPGGTMYRSRFKGEFTKPEKLDEYTYTMRINKIETEEPENLEYIENEMKIVTTPPYGLMYAEEIYIYLPGTFIYDMPEYVRDWIYVDELNDDYLSENQWVIYSPEDEAVFINSEFF